MCVQAVLQYVCVLVMFSHSTVCAGSYSQYVCTGYVSQHVCVLAVFTLCVCTGYVLPQHVCILAVFTVRVCTGYVLSQHVYVLAVCSTCMYWSGSTKACVCASSLAVCGCTGYGFP